MNSTSRWRLAPLLGAVLMCASCASGDGGGVTGTGLVIGPITGFGSIVVNGIEFDVAGAEITIDGNVGSEADLRLGMLVEVRGSFDQQTGTGTATSVTFDDQLQGPVESVDVPSGTIVVLGQLVLTDAATVFENKTLAELVQGDFVQVSGFRDADDNVRATLVSFQEGQQSAELEGVIAALDTGAQTFRINGQLVDYSSAQIENAPAGGLADGLFVEVRADAPTVGEILVADTVEVKNEGFDGQNGDDVEIEGVVSRVVSATDFVLNGTRPVRTGSNTSFEGGTAADIDVNVRLEATGKLAAGGTLLAETIRFAD